MQEWCGLQDLDAVLAEGLCQAVRRQRGSDAAIELDDIIVAKVGSTYAFTCIAWLVCKPTAVCRQCDWLISWLCDVMACQAIC